MQGVHQRGIWLVAVEDGEQVEEGAEDAVGILILPLIRISPAEGADLVGQGIEQACDVIAARLDLAVSVPGGTADPGLHQSVLIGEAVGHLLGLIRLIG